MSSTPNNKAKLAEAAVALVEAAKNEADITNQLKTVKAIEELKESFDCKLNTVTQTVKSNSENFDAKINTLNQHVMGLKSAIDETKSLLEKQYKQQRLEFAIANIDLLESFTCCYTEYPGSYNNPSESSKTLILRILKWFAFGQGYILPLKSRMQIYSTYSTDIIASQKAFRDKLSKQLEDLIGHEPRFQDKGDGNWNVFYE